MNREEAEIFELYAERAYINMHSYNLMGKMLDIQFIKEKIKRYNMKKVIIYGGGYLGIQLYQALINSLNDCIIVDKEKKLVINNLDIKVKGIEFLENEYTGQYVIVTPLRYYQEIERELQSIIPKEKIMFLGEFLREELA